MTRDDIIRMAEQLSHGWWLSDEKLETFAKLLVENLDPKSFMTYQEGYETGVVAEREACKNAVEDVARKYQKLHHASLENIADECAAAIRARGTT